MIEETGDTYQSAKYSKALFAAEAKVGKSTNLIAGALGVLPWQKNGGVVTRPDHLHVIAVDSGAVAGVKRFLLETCNAPAEALKFRVYNMQEDTRQAASGGRDWDFTYYNTLMNAVEKAQDRAARGGTHVLLFSSLTTIAFALKRAIAGSPDGSKGKGSGMDMAKWDTYGSQLAELRNFAHRDAMHCWWEGHIYKPGGVSQDKDAPKPETLQMEGKSGAAFPNNVEQVFRLRREFGRRAPNTQCDLVYLDTKATMDFVANGRNFNEALSPKEYDLTAALDKLGLSVGNWGARSSTPLKKKRRKAPPAE